MVIVECADDQLYLYLYDSFGDGWNGATLSVADCDGEMIAEGITLGGGWYSMDDVCLPAGDGYTVTAGGGTNISYTSYVCHTFTR